MNRFARFLRRSITAVSGFLLVASGALIVLAAAGLISPVHMEWYGIGLSFDTGQLPFLSTLGWVGIGLGVAVVGVLFVLLGFTRERKATRIVSDNGLTNSVPGPGQVTVSVRSIEALATYVVEGIAGVRKATPTASLKKDGWHIDCRVEWSAGSIGPDAPAIVKDVLQQSIARHTGYPVAHVTVETVHDAIQEHHVEAV